MNIITDIQKVRKVKFFEDCVLIIFIHVIPMHGDRYGKALSQYDVFAIRFFSGTIRISG